jgi:HEAT repeat protein
VRAGFAYFCPGFIDCFGEHWASVFIDTLESLMRDQDVNVRRLAVGSIPQIAETWLPPVAPAAGPGPSPSPSSHTPPDFATMAANKEKIIDSLLPGLVRLVSDPAVDVRAAVAAATGRLLRVLARLQGEAYDAGLDAKVVAATTPLLQRLLHDEAAGDVALALLDGMRVDERILTGPQAAQAPLVLVDSQVELLLPAVAHLATNASWRLRKAVVEALPTFQVMVLPGHPLDEHMQRLWEQLLRDGVENVRRTAGEYLCLAGRLVAAHGGDGEGWVEARVLPQCRACLASPGFKQRQLGIHMLGTLLAFRCVAEPVAEAELMPLLLAASADQLANVRIVAAMVIDAAGDALAEGLRGEGSPLAARLMELCVDKDRDVRYFARKACGKLGLPELPAPAQPPPPPQQLQNGVREGPGQGHGQGQAVPCVEAVGGGGGDRGAKLSVS